LGIACSLPSHGGRNEKCGLGLPVASALSATAAPVLRYARTGIAFGSGDGLAKLLRSRLDFVSTNVVLGC